MYAVITLSNPGADCTGPFNMWSDVDGYSAAFETNISLAQLSGGFSTNNIPEGTTTIRIRALSPSACKQFYVDTPII